MKVEVNKNVELKNVIDDMTPFGVVSPPNLALLPKLSLIHKQNATLQNAQANIKINKIVEQKTNTNGGGRKDKKNKIAKKLESKERK